jgi:hypothetical protein
MHRIRDAGHSVAATGKLHFRSTEDDNGFTEEIEPIHIAGGVGGLVGLLRASGDEPARPGNWDMYAKKLGEGTTTSQHYDRRITAHATDWLNRGALAAKGETDTNMLSASWLDFQAARPRVSKVSFISFRSRM